MEELFFAVGDDLGGGIIDLPMDWDLLDAPGGMRAPDTGDLVDWLYYSLTMYGRVDIIFIANELHMEYVDVIVGLQGKIYQNPETWEQNLYKGWEPADLYLSGNLRHKLAAAKAAAREYPGQFDANVRAIEAAMPEMVRRADIFVTLGSPWVPTDVIDAFVFDTIGTPPRRKNEETDVFVTVHDTITGTWEIPYKARYNRPEYKVQMTNTYGTTRMDALHILECTLNMQAPTIKDDKQDPARPGKFVRVVNREETLLATEKQAELIRAFADWVWQDADRRARLSDIFDRQYGCVVPRRFDGSFLRFPGMSPHISLFPHQKDAVARILLSANTLLAHDVGTGKTYVMIAAGMELRRMGISTKNMYVLPPTLLGQWESDFLRLYPSARLLVLDTKNFSDKHREATMEQIRDGDFDGILISYRAFEKIPLSRTYYERSIEIEQAAVDAALSAGADTKSLARRKKALANKLDALRNPEKEKARLGDGKDPMIFPKGDGLLLPSDWGMLAKSILESGAVAPVLSEKGENDEGIASSKTETVYTLCFDDLGITSLFVDEAHNFKNLPIETKIDSSIRGISSAGAAKCVDMRDKVYCVQRANGGRGVVMATGTPITNSITDVFALQTYLQSGDLALLDLQNFDSWVGMFAERAMEFEVDVDTNNFRIVSRFSKFHNLQVLATLLSYIADFHSPTDADRKADGLPQFDGYTDVTVPRTRAFSDFLSEISARAEAIRSGEVSTFEDNMLKITQDSRRAALDLRLLQEHQPFTCHSKVGRCAEAVYRIWFATAADHATQLVFCDTSIPKKGVFNIYEDMQKLLVAMGIPAEEIAFIHDATTPKKRDALFADVRAGVVRILLGSTAKLGTGVNVQDRLVAVHHLDVPWRPADMVQREGRILRRGNTSTRVDIFRYIAEGSFDAYSWQILETKQRFIANLLSNSLPENSAQDVAEAVLSYAEVKALAVGNPLLRRRIEVANELSKYRVLERKAQDARMYLEQELAELPATIAHRRQLIAFCEQDMAHLAGHAEKPQGQERAVLADKLAAAVERSLPIDPDRELFVYRGFQIVLPRGTDRDKPAVFAGRADRKSVV